MTGKVLLKHCRGMSCLHWSLLNVCGRSSYIIWLPPILLKAGRRSARQFWLQQTLLKVLGAVVSLFWQLQKLLKPCRGSAYPVVSTTVSQQVLQQSRQSWRSPTGFQLGLRLSKLSWRTSAALQQDLVKLSSHVLTTTLPVKGSASPLRLPQSLLVACSGLPWGVLNACGGSSYMFWLPQSLLKACRYSTRQFWLLQTRLNVGGSVI